MTGSLPKDHGLGVVHARLVETPHQTHVAILVFDCKKVTTDMDTGEIEPTARIRRIEVVDPSDYSRAEQMLRRALERRTGASTLPIDLEDEITRVFSMLDVTSLPEATSEDDGGDE